MSVWITRSAPDNLRTARELRALGQMPLMVPILRTVPRYQPPITSPPDAIVFTSVHAVRHFARHDQLLSVPVFAASGPVAKAASLAGYVNVTSTGGDDAMLSELVGHVLPRQARVLLLCGDSTSAIAADRLLAQGCCVERQAVYKSVSIQDDALAPVRKALDRVSAIVLHSRSSAERIVPLLCRAHWRGSLWCISEQAAHACSDLPHVTVHTAARPSERSLLDMIAQASPAKHKRPSRVRQLNAAMLMSALQSRPSSQRLTARNDNAPDIWRPDDDDPDPTAA
ncbi:uroporphyrinogen-III synthase [Sphingomonas aurantiaca]|jgi:uroporphyrinogen-III synthase|uniref:uroporphyrinogen-III synthase n=1 Tax=Sphingomonas aurantiaca TaxID=185949 RepID=UPI0012600BF1|nr:uroporphyrinogen-III synthase [Sphingomonas aurantiaca]